MTSFRRCCAGITAAFLLVGVECASAQTPVVPVADTSQAGQQIKVFLDCRGDTDLGCEQQFFVLDLPYVTWTRDRLFADVQFLVTTIQTGSGSFQYTVNALGRGRFAGRADTSVVNTIPNEAEDPIRRKLSRTFALLLVPYVRTTDAVARLKVVYDAPVGAAQASPRSVKDKWNFFIIELQGDGFLQTESRQTRANYSSDVRLRRVTEFSAIRFGVNQSARYNKFEINDSTNVTNAVRQGFVFARAVKSLSPRLSFGVLSNVGYSEFNNTKMVFRLAPVIEYNLFPWKQATSRQVAISYGIGPRYFRWTEPTIFGRSREWRAQQELVIGSDVRQSWGSVNLSTRYASFLPDVKKWNLSLNGSTNLNLVKGLQFNVGGGATLIRDQIFLAARNQTPEQILTQQRALASNYDVFVFAGLSYSFGSIYNSVVNPRLDFFRLGGGGR